MVTACGLTLLTAAVTALFPPDVALVDAGPGGASSRSRASGSPAPGTHGFLYWRSGCSSCCSLGTRWPKRRSRRASWSGCPGALGRSVGPSRSWRSSPTKDTASTEGSGSSTPSCLPVVGSGSCRVRSGARPRTRSAFQSKPRLWLSLAEASGPTGFRPSGPFPGWG